MLFTTLTHGEIAPRLNFQVNSLDASFRIPF
nr:MAG TPA: hypothetical protein [Caudoviricetes sp.]